MDGLGVDIDLVASLYYLEIAANSKIPIPTSQYLMGDALENGKGCQKDIQAAIYWYQKAAENNTIEAQQKLPEFYFNGSNEIKQNYKQSIYDNKTKQLINPFLCSDNGFLDYYYKKFIPVPRWNLRLSYFGYAPV